MADDRIKISIELDDNNVEESFQKIEVSAEKTAVTIENSFSKSLDSINSKSIEMLNANLETLNKTIQETNQVQNSMADDFTKTIAVLDSFTQIIEFVRENLDQILFVIAKLGKGNKKLIDLILDAVDAFNDLKRTFNQANFDAFVKTIQDLGSAIGLTLLAFDTVRVFKAVKAFGLLDNVILDVAKNTGQFGVVVGGAIAGTAALTRASKDLVKLGAGVGQVFFSNTKNVFGLTTALSGASVGLFAFSKAFERSNNEAARIASVISGLAALLLGGFAAALTFAIVKIGQLATELGTNLVRKFQAASQSFVDADKSLKLFTATVVSFNRITEGAVATTQEWNDDVAKLSETFNLSRNSLRKAGQEIIAVGNRIGLTVEQQRELLRVTAEYAKITGKDVFDASVAFVSGLNGQSQALLSYGVKLTEASNQNFLLKKGITDNFRTLTDSEKVQIRYNNLLSQYGAVAGLGAVAAGTLADQQNKLAVEVEKVNTKIGEGAALIEANNSVAFALNKALGLLSDGALKAFGFFGALGSRLLQVSGILLTFSFKIFAVTKGIKLLNVLLKSDLLQTAFARSIPLLGISFNQLVKDIGGANASLKKTSDIIPLLASIVTTQVKNIPVIIGNALRNLGAILVPLIPIILKVGAVIGVLVIAGKAVSRAFEELEEKSGAVSTITGILNDAFAGTKSVLDDLLEVFDPVFNALKKIFNIIVGGLVFGLSKLIQLGNKLVQANPFGAFSEETRKKFAKLNDDLTEVNENLLAVNFNIGLLGETSFSSASKAAENLGILRDKLTQVKNQITQILGESNEAQLEKLQADFDKRNQIIDESLQKGLLSQEKYNMLKLQNEAAFNQASKNLRGSLDKTIESSTKQLVGSISVITEAFVQGENGFEAFGKAVLGIVGDMLINIGISFINIAKAVEAIKTSLLKLTGGPGLLAGLALIAIGGALKGLSGGVGGIGTAGVGAGESGIPGGGVASTPTLDQQEVNQEPNTVVNVNVEGSILSDTREAGLQITNVLKEFFDTNGGGGVIVS